MVLSIAFAGFVLTFHSATAAGQAVKQCGFITQQQAEAIFGGHLSAGREMGVACAYSFGGGYEKGVLVSVSTFPGVIAPGALSQMYDSMIHSNPTDTAVPLGGLGEKASYVTSKDKTEATVEVMYHNSIIGVTSNSSSNPNLKDALIQAVRQVMQKL
jgi:hypothetical protein